MSIDWKTTLANENTSIIDVMRIIDKDSLKIACIVDQEMRLKGIVTDGDIRRALIGGVSLTAPISVAMNTDPTTVGTDYDHNKLLIYLKENSLLHMPIVESGKLVNLVTLEELLAPRRKDNPVFIMAGGFGTRLRPLTDNCPKPLLKVGEKPILETIIDSFVSHGFHNFYISTHYLPQMIMDYFGDGSHKNISIKYIHEEHPLGTGGALGLLPKDEINSPLIMINGDILTNVNFSHLLEYHNSSSSCATMAVREYDIKVPYGVVNIVGEHIKDIVEKPTHTFFVNAGIYVINPEVIQEVENSVKIDMPTLLENKIKLSKDVGVFPIHEYWLDIGQLDEFKKAQLDILNLF